MSALSNDLSHIARQRLAQKQFVIVYSSCWAGHIKTTILNSSDGSLKGCCGFPIEHVLAAHTVDEGWRDLI